MKKELVITDNSLLDIINWLKLGHIICIHDSLKYGRYYFSKETLDKITDEIIVYVNVESDPSLLHEDEWDWYINEAGFVKYTSIDIIPKDENNIYSVRLPSLFS
jgi:hypothetical protein